MILHDLKFQKWHVQESLGFAVISVDPSLRYPISAARNEARAKCGTIVISRSERTGGVARGPYLAANSDK